MRTLAPAIAATYAACPPPAPEPMTMMSWARWVLIGVVTLEKWPARARLRQPARHLQALVDVVVRIEQRRRDPHRAIPHGHFDLCGIECRTNRVRRLGRIERHDRRPIPQRREEAMSLLCQAGLHP